MYYTISTDSGELEVSKDTFIELCRAAACKSMTYSGISNAPCEHEVCYELLKAHYRSYIPNFGWIPEYRDVDATHRIVKATLVRNHINFVLEELTKK